MTTHTAYIKKDKKRLDLETFFVTGLISIAAAIGLIAIFLVLTGTDISAWTGSKTLGVFVIICSTVWGSLLIKELC